MISGLISTGNIKSVQWVVHTDRLIKGNTVQKTYCIADIKIDHLGRLVFADLDKIYLLDVNTQMVTELAESYTACKLVLPIDDKGLCLCLNPKKNTLFFAEKIRSGLKVLRLDLKVSLSTERAEPVQVFIIEDAQLVNLAAVDDSKLFILFNRNGKAHLRLIDLATLKFQEKNLSQELRGDHLAVCPELGLLAVSCVEHTKVGCVNHLKFFDIGLNKEVGYHKIFVPKPEGTTLCSHRQREETVVHEGQT